MLYAICSPLDSAGLAPALALQAFQRMIARRQLDTTATDMLHGIHLTLAEALGRNRSPDGTARRQRLDAGVDHLRQRRREWPLCRGRAPGFTGRRASPSETHIDYNGEGRSLLRNRLRAAGSWYLHLRGETRIIAINFKGRARLCNPARDKCTRKPSEQLSIDEQ